MAKRPGPDLYNIEGWKISAIGSDDLYRVEIFVEDGGPYRTLFGAGESRRRKGDPRKPEIGEALALARAFEDAGRRVRRYLKGRGYGDVK